MKTEKMGIQGIIYDIDNTLTPWSAGRRKSNTAFEHLRMLDLKPVFFSNNKEPRVKVFAITGEKPLISTRAANQEQKAIKSHGDHGNRYNKYIVCRGSSYLQISGCQPAGDTDGAGKAY